MTTSAGEWRWIPRRIFLDTCAFQAMVDCSGFVFAEEEYQEFAEWPPDICPQVLKRKDAFEILDALRCIFIFDERAQFDWILSEASLMEIDAGGDSYRSAYAREVINHSSICLSEDPAPASAGEAAILASSREFGFLSAKDKRLISDAVSLGCDTFLTIEQKLPRVGTEIASKVPLMVTTPQVLWKELFPHIRGL